MNWWDVLWILFIVLPLIMFWGFALVDLFQRYDLSGWKKAAWLCAIILLPVLGTLFYMIFRPSDLTMTASDRRVTSDAATYWDEREAAASGASRAQQLSLLADLHKAGQLSDSEFAAEKSRVLAGT